MEDAVRAEGFSFGHFSSLFEGAPAAELRQYGKRTDPVAPWDAALDEWSRTDVASAGRPDLCLVEIVVTVLAMPPRRAGVPTLMGRDPPGSGARLAALL